MNWGGKIMSKRLRFEWFIFFSYCFTMLFPCIYFYSLLYNADAFPNAKLQQSLFLSHPHFLMHSPISLIRLIPSPSQSTILLRSQNFLRLALLNTSVIRLHKLLHNLSSINQECVAL